MTLLHAFRSRAYLYAALEDAHRELQAEQARVRALLGVNERLHRQLAVAERAQRNNSSHCWGVSIEGGGE